MQIFGLQVMARLGLDLTPDKTFVGRVERGFDFLGYVFDGARVGVSEMAVGRFERMSRVRLLGALGSMLGVGVGGSGLGWVLRFLGLVLGFGVLVWIKSLSK